MSERSLTTQEPFLLGPLLCLLPQGPGEFSFDQFRPVFFSRLEIVEKLLEEHQKSPDREAVQKLLDESAMLKELLALS